MGLKVRTSDGNANNVNRLNVNRRDDDKQTHSGSQTSFSDSLKVITSKELFKAMGGRPSWNIVIPGLLSHPRSSAYKEVAGALDRFRKGFDQLANSPLDTLSKSQVESLKSDLMKGIRHADDYLDAHKNEPSKTERREVMGSLRDRLTQEIGFLDGLIAGQGSFPKDATVGNALLILKSGVAAGHLISDPHKTDVEVSGDNGPETLGSGTLNSVLLAKWRKPDQSIEQTVLKPIAMALPKGEGRANVAPYIGIPDERQMVGERNIATSKVASFLGLQSMAPSSNVIVFKGRLCLEMPLAEGKSFLGNRPTDVPKQQWAGLRQLPEEIIRAKRLTQIKDPETGEIGFVQNNYICRDYPMTSDTPNQLTANLQKEFLDLQVLDVLTGQADRNRTNFFIKVEGDDVKVTAIDHDLSFGENQGVPQTDISPSKSKAPDKPWPGLPTLMTKSTFDKLMSIKPAQYRAGLEESGLNKAQVDLAMTRLEKLRDHAVDLFADKLIVTDLTQMIKDPQTGKDTSVSAFLTKEGSTNYVAQLKTWQDQDLKEKLIGMND